MKHSFLLPFFVTFCFSFIALTRGDTNWYYAGAIVFIVALLLTIVGLLDAVFTAVYLILKTINGEFDKLTKEKDKNG